MNSDKSLDKWTVGLNPEQKEAVLHAHGPLLILAGAGSGKTTVLVSRTGAILDGMGVKASQVCVLTFTNKAARELKSRVAAKIGERAEGLCTGTFHSFGLRILRKYHKECGLPSGFGVIDQSDGHEILKELLSNIRNSNKAAFKAETLMSLINDWRASGRRIAQNEADEYQVMAQVLLPKYLKRLEMLGAVDFESLLLRPLQLFKEDPKILAEVSGRFQYVMVDEFQDTNISQFQLVQGLAYQHQNLAVVGDDDQSIYGWRGAEVSNILDFPKSFKGCKVIRLERNYRSTPAILAVANEVIAKNTTRHGKILRSEKTTEPGSLPEIFVYENDDIEAEEAVTHVRHFLKDEYVPGDIAVLYRSNAQGGMIEAQLRQNQIPYAITGSTGFFDRKEVKDVLAYLRCSIAPGELQFRRIFNTPVRGVGESTVEKIVEHAKQIGFAFHVAARAWRKAGVQEKIGEHIDALFRLLDGLPDLLLRADPSRPVSEVLLRKLEEIGYRDHLRTTTKDDASLQKRWAILEILGRVLDGFIAKGRRDEKTLLEFLDAMELRDPVEDEEEDRTAKVQLLTLHACKGLEFPAVIFIGCEEDLLPHRTLGSDVAEERRLFYVGLTRAKKRLVLTRAKTRKRFGRFVPVAPSRFLLEIPSHLVKSFDSGFRPVNDDEKKDLLADLFRKIDSNAAKQKLL